MNTSNFRFTLDLHSAQSQYSIPAMVGDTAVSLHISITDGGVPYVIEDGCLAKITIKRPTKTYLEEFCKIKNNAIIEYPFSENTCVIEGIHNCDITLYDANGERLGSPMFTMVVSEKVMRSTDVEVSDEDKTVVDAMIQAEASRQYAEEKREEAESARISAEEERIANEKARQEASSLILEKAEEVAVNTATATNAATVASESATIATEKADIAVTSASDAEQSAIQAKASEEIAKTIASNSVSMEARISRNEKQITNILTGMLPSPFETDDSVAYIKDVPVNALPYAEVSKVGGMTRKCKNLFDPSKLLTADGWSVDANGVYTGRSGSLTSAFTQSNPYMTFNNVDSLTLSFYGRFEEGQNPAGLYFQFKFDDGTIKSYAVNSAVDTYYTYTVQKAGAKIVSLFYSYGSGYGTHYLRNIQIEAGTTATDYEPYYEGLRDTAVTEIKSVGANLFNDIAWFTENNFTKQSDGSWLARSLNTKCWTNTSKRSGSMYITFIGKTALAQAPVYLQVKYTDGSTFAACILHATEFTLLVDKTDANKTVDYISWTYGSATGDYYVKGVSFSFVDVGYKPYTETSLVIPEAVQSLDGYGWGINADCFNYIDWEKKQFVKRVSSAVLNGSENWMIWGSGIVTDLFDNIAMKNTASVSDCEYEVVIGAGSMMTVVRTNGAFTVEEWKAYLAENPATVMYQLATPIVTDISNLITDDNFIKVEGGGSITAVNEHGASVPSEITYMLKEVAE